MRCLPILLVSILALLTTEAKLPDFIHTCKRDDPGVNDCIQNTIHSLRSKLAEGIPELGVKKIDPMNISKLPLNLGPGISALGKNIQLSGLRNLQVMNLVTDFDEESCTFDLMIPKIAAHGECELDATIGPIPFKGNGPISFTADSITGRITIHGKLVPRGGKTRYYYPSMDLKLDIKNYNLTLENVFKEAPEIGNVVNKLLNEEKKEVLSSIVPTIEKVMVKEVLDYSNTLVKPFTLEELFA